MKNSLRSNLTALAAAIIIVAVMLALLVPLLRAKASPSEFIIGGSTSSVSTSTYNYLTAGTGTTTLAVANCASSDYALDKNNLLLWVKGSSTAAVPTWRFQHSPDGLSWYEEDATPTLNATTTVHSQLFANHNFSFASTTPLTGGTSDVGGRMIEVPVRLRCMRVVITAPVGSTNFGVWAGWVGKRESLNR